MIQMNVGDKLGPYEIVALIGKGGMGEVYRAHDPRLGRDVAIKVSAERFSARFEREARAVAALNHPNICTLYDVGPNYLVMEYVEGENLKGPLALDEALRIARQIADALEAAHEKPIVHRDLKPANIKIRPDGTVKVLDFGLAKMHEPPGEDGDTVRLGLTEAGTILGTPAYMSPEQALGAKADKRSDIWAFGVVLYEMLTGERLFKGRDMGEILVSVVKEQPDLSGAPVEVRRLLGRCLEKDPRKRLRDIGDVWELLETAPETQTVAPSPSPSRLGWAVAAALAVALGVSLWTLWPQPIDRPLIRLTAELGPDAIAGVRSTVAISPDGRRIVYAIRGRDGKPMLATRTLDQAVSTPLLGTEDGADPFFSPDGAWIGFAAEGKLKKIAASGGGAVVLCDASNFRGATWRKDGVIVAALTLTGTLKTVPEAGGTPVDLDKPFPGGGTHRWPYVLPDGSAVLYTASTSPADFDNANISVISLKTGQQKTLVRGGYFPRYLSTDSSSGYLLYIRQGVLLGVAFDPARLELRGTPVPLLEDIASVASNGAGQFDVSRTGTLVYLPGQAVTSERPLAWLGPSGKLTPFARPGNYRYPQLSPDGKSLVVSNVVGGVGTQVFLYDFQRDFFTRLTLAGGPNQRPVWAPDGKHVVYQSTRGIYWIRSDGAGEPVRLLDSTGGALPFSFTPDGKRLAYEETGPNTGADLWTLPLDLSDPGHPKPGPPEAFLRTPAAERNPAFSPDGRWIAYTSDEGGRSDVFVRPFPGPGGKWQISSAGGNAPQWSGDGKQLFFQSRVPSQIWVAEISTKGSSFAAGPPRAWSSQIISDDWFFAMAKDGKRAVVFQIPSVEPSPSAVHVVFLENFSGEVRRLIPEGK